MHPILFQIGSLPIHTYGALIALGFLAAVWIIKRLCIQSGLDAEKVLDLVFWCFLVGFAGARVTYIITQYQQYENDWLSMLKIWQGGLVFYGGPLAVLPFCVWYLRKHKMPMWKVMDTFVIGLTVGHAFGRLGCLGAGCCYGLPTSKPWGIKLYSDLVEKQFQGISLHPTQLYEAGALTVLVGGLLWIFKHRKFDGQVVLSYFLAYPMIRSLIELYRGDIDRGWIVENYISTSQGISIVVFVLAAVALVYRLKAVESAGTAEKTKGQSKGKSK